MAGGLHVSTPGNGNDCSAWSEDLVRCPTGRELFRRFREIRPNDYAFLEARDLFDQRSLAFEGTQEWDAFVEHCQTCKSCVGTVAETEES